MRSLTLVALAGFLWVSAGTNRADEIVEPTAPPKEKTLTGTLCWQNIKKHDGSVLRGNLLLTMGKRRLVLPIMKGKLKVTKAGDRIDLEKYVGKRVKLTAMVVETARRGGTKTIVTSVTRIEEGS